MSTYTAGDARLAIIPDASGFKKKLEADMSKVQAEFGLNVTAKTAQARADINRLREAEQRGSISLNIDADVGKLKAELAALRATQHLNPVEIPVELDRRGLTDSLARAQSDFGKAGGMFPLKLDIAALGVSLIPGAVAGLTDLAGAMQQVAQAGLVVPGAIAGVGASIGTMAIGLSGISDAYKEVSKAAEQSGQDQAAQARAATQAQQQLRNAAVDDANAHKDLAHAYSDARRELEDLNISARGGQISEQQAINDALKARRDLAKGGFRDQLDLNDALLRVQSADQRVVEAHQRNIEFQERLTDANARGVEGSDRVVAAQERVARSGQQLADAQAAVEQSTAKTSAAAVAADAAMAKLSPNARELVTMLRDLTPVFQSFRNAIAEPLLDGVAGEIRTLVDSDLPLLEKGMGGLATALNKNFKTLLGSLGSDNTKSLIDRILGNTTDAQQRLGAVIDPLVRGIGTLTAAGSDALPRLADDMAKIAEHFADFIEAADKDGRLDKWINDGITGVEHLGAILKNLGSSFLSITRAAGGGAGLLGTIDQLTGKWAAFLKSDEGQQKLRDFFQQAREDLEKWKPILEALPGMIGGLIGAGQEFAKVVVPPIADIAELLGKYPGLLKLVVDGFLAWKTLSFAANIVSEVGRISDVLGFAGGGKKGAGGRGLLGKLGVALAMFELLDAFNRDGGPPPPAPSAGDVAADLGGNVATNAVTGAMVAGGPGAIAGAGVAVVESTLGRAADDFARQQAASQQRAAEQAQQHANDTTGPYAPPALPTTGGPDALRQMILDGRFPGYSLTPEGKIVGPDGKYVDLPGFAGGGPTPSGRGSGPTGGWLAEIHSDEWVLPRHARQAVGDDALWALTSGRSFDLGGFVDPTGNPVTPGAAPGVVAPAGNPLIAPSPATSGGGLLGAFLGGMLGGLGNLASVGLGLAGAAIPAASGGVDPAAGATGTLSAQMGITGLTQAGTPEGLFASRAAQLPGLWGLLGGALSPDPVGASMQWAGQTMDWAGSTVGGLLNKAGSTLLTGALSAVGLQDSILSPSNVYNQALSSTGNYFLGGSGPVGTLLGAGSGSSAGGSGSTGATPQLGSQSIALGDGSTIQIPTFGTASGAATGSGGGLPGTAPAGSGEQLVPGQWSMMDALAQKFHLSMTSGFRSANGPTIAGVPAGQSFHASGRAHDYSNGRQTKEELAFAQYVAAKYGAQLKELIFDYPGFNATVKDGRVVGPFGAFYTLGQAGDHSNHVHVAFGDGGSVSGPGGPKDDKIPAWLSNDEHVFTAADVAAMGGHQNVYAFRNALHRADGGPIMQAMVPPIKPLPAPPVPTPTPAPTPAATINPSSPNAVTPIGTPPPPPGAQPPAAGPSPAGPGAPQAPLPDQNGGDRRNTALPGDLTVDDMQRAAEKIPGPGGGGMGAAPTSRDHELTALSTLVNSSAQNIGSWVNTAISAAAAGASAAGGAPGAGGAVAGLLGPMIQGGFTQGAKVVNGGINVLSSLMVGNVPGSYGAADDATGYGQLVRAQQRDPVTAPAPRVQNNTFNGMDVPRVFQELDLRDAQHRQAQLAGYRG